MTTGGVWTTSYAWWSNAFTTTAELARPATTLPRARPRAIKGRQRDPRLPDGPNAFANRLQDEGGERQQDRVLEDRRRERAEVPADRVSGHKNASGNREEHRGSVTSAGRGGSICRRPRKTARTGRREAIHGRQAYRQRQARAGANV